MKTITLTRGLLTKVDDSDFEELSKYKWYPGWNPHTRSYYAMCNISRKVCKDGGYHRMHRLIMGLTRGDKKLVDHINGDTLDNQRTNLRVCDPSLNARNSRKRRGCTSQHKGVYKERNRWIARRCNGVVGRFATEEEAIAAVGNYYE